jgi:hypothetical protein
MAQMMRVGLYRPVHVKTLRSQKLRMLLTHRKLLQSQAIAIENDVRATLRNFGLKVGIMGTAKFEARIRELVENLPDLAVLVEPLLIVRRVAREQLGFRKFVGPPRCNDARRCHQCGCHNQVGRHAMAQCADLHVNEHTAVVAHRALRFGFSVAAYLLLAFFVAIVVQSLASWLFD